MAKEKPVEAPPSEAAPAEITLREYANEKKLNLERVAALARRLGWKLHTRLTAEQIETGLKKAMTERI
jgi:hypothetical protein